MKYIINETNQKANIYLSGNKVALPNEKGEIYYPLDNTNLGQAQEWTRTFTILKIVEQEYIDNLLANKGSTVVQNMPPLPGFPEVVQQPVQMQQQVQIREVIKEVMAPNSMPKPTVQTVQNEDGDNITIYKLPILNSNAEIVDHMGILFNEDKNILVISSVNTPVKLSDRLLKKQVEETVPVIAPEVETPLEIKLEDNTGKKPIVKKGTSK